MKRILVVTILVFLIFGCGGGGSGDTNNNPANTQNQDNTINDGKEQNGSVSQTQIFSQNTTNKKSPFGITPGAVSYYMTEFMLIDSFKHSGKWLTQASGTWDTKEQNILNLDENGWVKSLRAKNPTQRFTKVSKLIYHDTNNHHPKGNHIVLYDGEGEIKYYLGAKKIESLSTQGRDIVKMDSGSFMLSIEKTDPQNYIRNIRIIKPGGICDNNPYNFAQNSSSCKGKFTPFESIYKTQIFHPTFLNELKHYSVVRGMVMQETLKNVYGTWEQRPKLTDASWSSQNGVPFEILVTYANLSNTDLWINIPAHADDKFVKNMAKYIKENLNSNRKVYTEYFDEAWNRWGFYAQYGGDWMQEEGLKKWPGSNSYQALLNWYGMRTSQICKIFKNEFGSYANRVKCTMNSQAASYYVSEQMLGCPLHVNSGGEVCAKNIDYLGIAPYFGGYLGDEANVNEVSTWNVDKIFDELFNGGNLPNSPQGGALNRSKKWMIESKKVADRFNVGMVAYEGGQHLVAFGSSDNKILSNLFSQANKDPRMGELYMRYFKDWKEAGGELFVVFVSMSTYGGYGSWGNKEFHEQNPAPKADAVINFYKANPCWWNDCELK